MARSAADFASSELSADVFDPSIHFPFGGQGLDRTNGAVGPFPVFVHFVEGFEADAQAANGFALAGWAGGFEVQEVDDSD